MGLEIESLEYHYLVESVQPSSPFSRVEPQNKQSLVTILRSQREVMSMSSDGLNDAPVLKKAYNGNAMGYGNLFSQEL